MTIDKKINNENGDVRPNLRDIIIGVGIVCIVAGTAVISYKRGASDALQNNQIVKLQEGSKVEYEGKRYVILDKKFYESKIVTITDKGAYITPNNGEISKYEDKSKKKILNYKGKD